ncbi:unnamed protein product [Adineta ricciae]|uniref:F-box only protein 32 n=2 Tax=Adineta ricciae TaxID=249248 RepID=A0A814KQL6_ADIRI|nr:unnamed protein product [Adineta ricciae]
MPFIGRDWRADGEQWTKSEIGSWERSRRISFSNLSSNYNCSLSDIFNALDIVNSVTNQRRFNYIAKVVQILFAEKLGELSGTAQRCLFQILDRMIQMVLTTGDNILLMQRLVTQFHDCIHRAYPFYYYIGSAALWRQNTEILTRMKEKVKHIHIQTVDQNKATFNCLPTEIQREIVRKLDNGIDLINFGMINSSLHRLTQELLLWKQLCLYHFGDETQSDDKMGDKILGLLRRQSKDFDKENIDWKKVYFKLKRQHGLREVYADMIHQCQLCKNLFWQDCDHSCLYETRTPSSKSITPRKLVNMLI